MTIDASLHGLNNNPSPNASTGFKLTTGNAYRKLDQSWPIYQPIDGTKQGKGKDQSGWQSSEQSTAASDAPSVSGSGTSDSSKFQSYLNTKQALERIGILFDGTTARNVVTLLPALPTQQGEGLPNHQHLQQVNWTGKCNKCSEQHDQLVKAVV
ncbi:hypothetical protein V4Q74_00045 [Mycoplasmoides genitalium]